MSGRNGGNVQKSLNFFAYSLGAYLLCTPISSSFSAEPADETILFTVTNSQRLVDVVAKGPWKTLKNTTAEGRVPGSDWKVYVVWDALIRDDFYPVNEGAMIAPRHNMTKVSNEAPHYLEHAPKSYKAMSGLGSVIASCPDPGEGKKPNADSCLKPSSMEGFMVLEKSRAPWEAALTGLSVNISGNPYIVSKADREALIAKFTSKLQAQKQREEELTASRQRRQQESEARRRAFLEETKRAFAALPSGTAMACDSSKAPNELGGTFASASLDCVFGDGAGRREIRIGVSEILSSGWSVESQNTIPTTYLGQRVNNYIAVFRKR